MVERGQHLRLALEACAPVRIERERIGNDFERDVATELRIARAIHLAHPARAERRDDLIRPEAAAGADGHGAAFVAFSDATQFSTTLTSAIDPEMSAGVIMMNRSPPGATPYVWLLSMTIGRPPVNIVVGLPATSAPRDSIGTITSWLFCL